MGSPVDFADQIAKALSHSDMCGNNTHGLGLLPIYAKMVNDGAIDPLATTKIIHKTDSIIHVDGKNGFGQITGELATRAAIEAAQKSGLAMVAIENASHLGRLGEWANMAAEAGLAFTAFSNTGGGAKNVAAFGGHERKLSTNPVAFSIPTFAALPFNIVVDFATSQVAGSVIREHYRTNKTPHDDWTITQSGAPVAEALDFMNGEGALLPLGGRSTGHKGYGLAIVAELLGGIAGGMVVGQHHPEWFSNAAIFNLFDPLHFLKTEEIEARVNAIVKHLDEEQVRLPGQGSFEKFRLAQKEGINIETHILDSLIKLAKELGVEVNKSIFAKAGDSVNTREDLISW